MYKIEVLLNEEKINNEGQYSLEKIYGVLDDSFINDALMELYEVRPDGTRVYLAKKLKHKDHFAMIGNVICDYMDEQWFTDNVLKYLYFNSGGSYNFEDFRYEDILEEWEVGKSVIA